MNIMSCGTRRLLLLVATTLAVCAPSAFARDVSTRIVGGSVVSTPQPWVAAVLYNGRQGCGGSLIAPQWVVTAAHCVSGASQVRLGSLNSGSGGQVVGIAQAYIHPGYSNNVGGGNDIALLRLQTAVSGITPITIGTAPASGNAIRLLGWGQTTPQQGAGTASPVLKQLDTQVLATSNCTGYRTGDICIRGTTSQTACYGDSGGPALVGGLLVGATSRAGGGGSTCGTSNVLYTSVVYFKSWIQQYVTLGGGNPPTGQTYTNAADYTINDNATVSSPITVSGRTGNGSATTPVAVNIVHTYKGDLKVDLVAPDGSVYVLHNYAGGNADNINQTYTVNLSGEALNGTWNLRVNDNAANDVGYINSWSVTF